LNDAQTRIPLIARGVPLEIAEPFGQVDLRNALGRALARSPSDGDAPRLTSTSGPGVFQYLGEIDRPRQIGFADAGGRLLYDFRDQRVVLPDGSLARPDALSGELALKLQQLVQFWERLMIARAETGAARGGSRK
jgi:hypothetical protein